MSRRILLIGIDAGSFDIIDPLLEAGEMFNLADLLDRGYRATLESSVPPWTPTAWTSLTTGKNPGKHGIFDFKTTDQEQLVSAGDVMSNRIWHYLDMAGYRSIVVNVPVTHPASSFDGVLVPGYLGPEADECVAYPPGIVEELQEAIGDYRVYASSDHNDDSDKFEEYLQLMEMRKDAIVYLCNSYDWEFAMVQFQRTDTVFHELPADEYVTNVYERIDQLIGEIINQVGADTVLLASDHGMGVTGRWDFRINSWLREESYLETAPHGYEPGWNKPKPEDDDGSTATLRLASLGLTAKRIESVLNALGLTRTVARLIPRPVLDQIIGATAEHIDRSASAAYCPSGVGLGIYCPDKTVVEPLVDDLRGLEDPDGKQVFEFVKRAENVYEGPLANTGPDVVVLPRDLDYFVSAMPSSNVFEETWHRYNHKLDGLFVAAGDEIATGDATERRHIMDVTPTVLALLGIELDDEFDGSPVADALDGIEIPGTRSYAFEEASTDRRDSELVESRLEDLGYM